jgi:hypothetical protein
MLLGILHFTFFRNNSILDLLHEHKILLKEEDNIRDTLTSAQINNEPSDIYTSNNNRWTHDWLNKGHLEKISEKREGSDRLEVKKERTPGRSI